MAIETAGQQKYADLTAKRIKSLQTGMIVWISLLCLALICSFDNIMLAAIIGCVGLVLAVLNTKARKEFNRKLDRVKDKEEFYRQLAAPDVLELKEEQLLIAKDYVVTVDTDVEIYDLNQMEKLEVGKQGNKKLSISFSGAKSIVHTSRNTKSRCASICVNFSELVTSTVD